jgi:hypothetical protein
MLVGITEALHALSVELEAMRRLLVERGSSRRPSWWFDS